MSLCLVLVLSPFPIKIDEIQFSTTVQHIIQSRMSMELMLPGLLRDLHQKRVVVVRHVQFFVSCVLYSQLFRYFGSSYQYLSCYSESGGVALTEGPKCPYCENLVDESIPENIEGSIIFRCSYCEERFEYIAAQGSFPLDSDYAVRISRGLLGSKVMTDDSSPPPGSEMSLSMAVFAGFLCCCTIAILLPVLLSLLLAIFG